MNAGKVAGRMIARNILNQRNYGSGNLRQSVMNDLPKPEGDFFAHNASIQRGHNALLAFGVVLFTSTVYMTYQSKLINFNYSPPDTYE